MKGVIIVLAMLFLIYIPAPAQENRKEPDGPVFTPYIFMRMTLGAWHRSDHYKDNYLSTPMVRKTDDTDYWQKIFATSRFGLNAQQGALAGNVEFGLADPNIVSLRHLFFTYTYRKLGILVGQTWTPYSFFAGEKADDDSCMIGFGTTYDSRLPQVKVTLYGFYIDVIRPAVKPLTSAENGIEIRESYIDLDKIGRASCRERV